MNTCSISATQLSASQDKHPVAFHFIGTANTVYEAHEKDVPITGEMLAQAFLTNAVFGYPGGRGKVGVRAVEEALTKIHSGNTPGIPQGLRTKLAEEKGAIGETPKGPGEKLVPATPEEFIASREKSKYPQYLTPYTAEELSGFKIFKVENKDAGYALKPDGDLVNVHNAANEPGLGDYLVKDAISKGASKLDCYDGFLAKDFYPRFGFEIVAREPWNEAYRPAKWLDTDKTPDIVYMQLKRGEENAYNFGKSENAFAGGRTTGQRAADTETLESYRESDTGSRGGVDNEQQASTPLRMGVLRPELTTPATAETGIKSQTKTESPSGEGIKQEETSGALREKENRTQGKVSSPQPERTGGISPRDITREDIAEFLEREPVGTEKARYGWLDDTEKNRFIDSVERFLEKYGNYTDTDSLIGKFGHKIVFAPDERAFLERKLNEKDAWIEYAAHSFSGKRGSSHVRYFDSSKAKNLEGIEAILRDADGFVNEGKQIKYYKMVSDEKRGHGVIILEVKKRGDRFEIGEDCLRYVTHLPNKNKKYIEDLIRGAASTTPAVEAPSQDEPTGTEFPIKESSLSNGPIEVKNFDVMALLGLDRDNDDWRNRGRRMAYA